MAGPDEAIRQIVADVDRSCSDHLLPAELAEGARIERCPGTGFPLVGWPVSPIPTC